MSSAATEVESSTRTLPIIEIFSSIQGEGTRVGEPATFIRLAGCNLRCTWCDTPYSWSVEGVRDARKLDMDKVSSEVRDSAVVITGGEPLLHIKRLPELIAVLRRDGVQHITVETNGTIVPASIVDDVDLWSVSPKLPGSGESPDADAIRSIVALLRQTDRSASLQLKFVLADIAVDWDAMWKLLREVDVLDLIEREQCALVVQPDGLQEDYPEALRQLSEFVSNDTVPLEGGLPRRSLVRVIPQTHRVAWGLSARGV